MAELPRYSGGGARTAGVPELQVPALRVADVDRPDLRGTALGSGISAAIDRMSDALFKEAAQQMTERGMQYALENPPSLEQVHAAMAAGASPADLFVAGNTFFAQGARKTQAALVSQELHSEGMKVVSGVLADIERGKVMDLDEVRARIDGAVGGMAKSLDKVAPEEALRLRATMATLGNNAYTKAAEKIYARQKDDSKIAIETQMQVAPKILESIIERGDILDMSKPDVDARKGELGSLRRPDGGVSTELSVTVTDPRLAGGRATNIPLLVAGQKNVQGLLAGDDPTEEQIEFAIRRAATRTKGGAALPSYDSVEEAVAAAKSRPESDKTPYNRVVTPEMQIDVYRANLLRSLAAIGDPAFAQQSMDRFNGLVSKARVGVVTAHVSSPEFTRDAVGALQAVRTGQIGKLSGVYAGMNQEEKDKVRQNMMATMANQSTLDEQARNAAKRTDEIAVNSMLIQYHGMQPGPQKTRLASEIAAKNVLPPSSLQALLKGDEDGGDPIKVAKGEELIEAGIIRSLPDLNRAIPGLTGKQQVELQRKIFAQGTREESEASRMLRTAAGIPDGPVFLDRGSEQAKAYMSLTDSFRAKEDEARRAGVPFNPVKAAQEVMGDRDRQAGLKRVEAAKVKLEVYEEQLRGKGRGGSIDENTSIEDLRALKVFDGPTLEAIARQQKVIKSGGR
jgi:hypothetical protein